MVKKILLALLLCIFVLQGVSGADIKIQLKTPPNCEVHLSILDVASGDRIDGSKGNSNSYGDINFTFALDESLFDLIVVLKKNHIRIYSEEFKEHYPVGELLYLEIIPEGYELVQTPGASENETNSTENLNQTQEETLNQTIEGNTTEPENKSGILGWLGLGGDNGEDNEQEFSFPKALYYIIGGILLLIIAFFVFKFLRTKKTHGIKITKLSNAKAFKAEDKDAGSKEGYAVNKIIKEAEEKIKQAQDELNGLKKAQRIKEIKEKMLKEKKELYELSH